MADPREELAEKLISDVEQNPVLDDKTDELYKDVEKKNDILNQIGVALGISGRLVLLFFNHGDRDRDRLAIIRSLSYFVRSFYPPYDVPKMAKCTIISLFLFFFFLQ